MVSFTKTRIPDCDPGSRVRTTKGMSSRCCAGHDRASDGGVVPVAPPTSGIPTGGHVRDVQSARPVSRNLHRRRGVPARSVTIGEPRNGQWMRAVRMVQHFRHQLALLAQPIDAHGERSDRTAHEEVDRFAGPNAAARRVSGERYVLVGCERRVQVELAASRVRGRRTAGSKSGRRETCSPLRRGPEAAGRDQVPLASEPVVELLSIDAADHEQELEPAELREIHGVTRNRGRSFHRR